MGLRNFIKRKTTTKEWSTHLKPVGKRIANKKARKLLKKNI